MKTLKRWTALVVTLLMTAGLLAACGGDKEPEQPPEDTPKAVDLTEVFDAMFAALQEEAGELPEDYLVDIEGQMLDEYYPGLSDITFKQLIAKTPLMSGVACEMVLAECETEEDADKTVEILQARVDYQVGDDETPGGAWYPENIESWKKSSILRQGNYVAMLAVSGIQTQVEEIFNQAFQ